MKLKLSEKYAHSARLALMAVAAINLHLLVSSIFTEGTDSDLLVVNQIIVSIITLIYTYFKTRLLSYPIGQLVVSAILAGVYIHFCATVFPLLGEHSTLLLIVESINIIIAILLLAEAVFTLLLDKEAIAKQEEIIAENRRVQEERARQQAGVAATDSNAIPTVVHLYQPRLDFLPPPSTDGNVNNRSSNTSSSADGNGAEEVRLDIADDYELEELPKYQRKRPAQSATIIDMANLASVSPVVLDTIARPLSSSSLSSSEVQQGAQQRQDQGQEQEQQTSQQDNTPSSEASEYSSQAVPPPTPSPLSSSNPPAPSISRTPTQPPTYVP
jgi:hypothetical protein